MFDGRFAGFADFLVLEHRGRDRYRLRDTKLARSVKVEALLQLAAYADTLAADGVPVADEVELVLGDGAVASYRVDELLPVYLPRRAALQRLLDGHLAGGAAGVVGGRRGARVLPLPRMRRPGPRARRPAAGGGHAGQPTRPPARRGRRAPVHAAGRHTRARCPNCRRARVNALTAQARLQVAPRVDGKPPYEVVDAQPLMVLPDADKGDLFFDFEGDPLWTRRRSGVGPGIPVGRARPPPTSSHPYLGARPGQRAPGARRLPGHGAQAPQALPEHARLPLRGVREEHAAAPGRALRRRRGRRRRPAAQRRAGRSVSVGAQEHSGRHRELQHQVRSSRSTWATNCAAAR